MKNTLILAATAADLAVSPLAAQDRPEQIIRATRAWKMLAEFEEISGKEAVAAGLVTDARPAENLADMVGRRADALPEIDPEALFLTKRQFRAISARASFGNIEDLDGALLLGPLRGPKVREKPEGL